MDVTLEPLRVSTRRAVSRILGSADTLPERSKASKVLTAVACRIQLFVIEVERAHPEHFGQGIEALLWRLQQHCQLLAVADKNGGGIQSGYALLSELSELLQDLEASILLIPAQLGSDERYKPALDELQVLLANVSLYRIECDDTRSHLEAALSELVQGSAVSYEHAPEALDVVPADAVPAVAAARESVPAADSGHGVMASSAATDKGAAQVPSRCGKAAPTAASEDRGDLALLRRVRHMICALDLDVDVNQRDQDLDAELLQLRNHMQQALDLQHEEAAAMPYMDPDASGARLSLSQLSTEPSRSSAVLLAASRQGGRRWPSLQPCEQGSPLPVLPPSPPSLGRLHAHKWQEEGSEGPQGRPSYPWEVKVVRDVDQAAAAEVIRPLPYIPLPGSISRQGGCRWAPEAPHVSELEEGRDGLACRDALLWGSPALNGSGGACGVGDGGGGGRVRILDTQCVARQMAAQHLAHLKEQRRRLFRCDREDQDGSGDAGSTGGDGTGVDEGSGGSGSDGLAPWTRRRSRRVRAVQVTAAAADVVVIADSAVSSSGEEAAAVRDVDADHVRRRASAVQETASTASAATRQAGASDLADTAAGTSASHWGDEDSRDGTVYDSGGASNSDGISVVAAWDREASVAAVRHLNRVTTLAGMWEAGGPLAAAPVPALPALCQGPQGRCPPCSPFIMIQQRAQAQVGNTAQPLLPGRLKIPGAAAAEADALESAGGYGGAAGGLGAAGAASAASSPKDATAAAAHRHAAEAPPPLPRPEALVHLRAVAQPVSPGAQRAFLPWPPQGPFLPPGYGMWPWTGLPADPGAAVAAAVAGRQQPLLDFGPDVPTLDLWKDITSAVTFLGRGAFGAVYKAMFRDKPAAVKVLYGSAVDVADLDALRTEIRLLCGLRNHPNIITVYGAAVAPPDQVALVTELMDCDLYDYIHRRRQNCVPLGEVLFIARCIANGLAGLHPAIVHRDLKPANVLLKRVLAPPPQNQHQNSLSNTQQQQQQQQQQQGGNGGGGGGGGQGAAAQAGGCLAERRLVVKIADFGLARHKRSQYLSTRDGQAGTLKYMAPECVASGGGSSGGGAFDAADGSPRGRSGVSEKCDIYSFGVLLYELITGREPWEGCHDLFAFSQVQKGVRLALPDNPARCPAPLRSLVERCWAPRHRERPSSSELVEQLDAIIAQLAGQGLLQDEEGVLA